MLEAIKIQKNSDIPIYLQIAEEFRRQIEIGKLTPGSKMPSRRTLTKILSISANTVNSAYNTLLQEGLILTYPKSGYVVASNKRNNVADWSSYIKRAKHKPGNNEMKFWADAGGLSDFGLSSDFDIHPYIVEAMKNAVTRSYELDCKSDYSIYGYTPLRKSIVKHVEKIGIKADVKNILICPGGVQVLYPLYESLMTSGSNFLHEQSNIISAISDIHSIGMNMLPIPIDEHGLSAMELEKAIMKYKHPVLHVDLTDQAPTGTVMSKQRKKTIMQIVDKYHLPVIEIEHLRDVWHTSPFPPPLKSMDKNGNVIYLGMFVRSCPFDLQTSWIVADEFIINHLGNVFIQDGVKANYFIQIVVDEMFRSGMYDVMMKAVRRFIGNRRTLALELCNKYLSKYGNWVEKNCNFHFWLNFPSINTRVAFKNKYFKHFHPGYFFNKSDTTHILICPSSIREEELERSIKDIATLVEEYIA